jgi:hypothetical protein
MNNLSALILKVGFLFWLSTSSSWAILIALNPPDQIAKIGDVVQVDLVVSGLGESVAPSLASYDVDINFDPTILNFSGAVFGDPKLGNQLDFFGLGSLTSFTDGGGTANVFELSFDDPAILDSKQKESFTLVQLSFLALQPGNSLLDLSVNALADSLGNPLATQVLSGNIQVGAIPEPSSILLVVIGLTSMLRRLRIAT